MGTAPAALEHTRSLSPSVVQWNRSPVIVAAAAAAAVVVVVVVARRQDTDS
jgi:hypothetical protein